jgi:hypothetical protein
MPADLFMDYIGDRISVGYTYGGCFLEKIGM